MSADVASAPEWLGAALLGAVLAALGYLCKLTLEWIAAFRATRRQRISRLVELHSLLQAGRVAFLVQARHRNDLSTLLEKGKPEGNSRLGFEKRFAAAFPDMSPSEREIHSLIRSITVHMFRPHNQALLTWLQEDTYFRAARGGTTLRAELARDLGQLEAHLLLWNAKYEMWIPGHKEHALVYLVDEEKHGVGFPLGLQEKVEAILAKRWWFVSKRAMRTFAVLAILGVVGNLVWHVLALTGRVTEFTAPVLVVAVAMFVVLFPALVAGVTRARGADRSKAWSVMLGPDSKMAERLVGSALIYAVVIGAIMQRTPYLAWLAPASRIQVMISSGWLVFYILAAVLLRPALTVLSSREAPNRNRRPDGQAV